MATPEPDPEPGLTDEDLQDLHEDILDRNEEGVRELLQDFLDQGLPIKRLCCTEVELEPASHDHDLNLLPLSGLHRAALIESHGILDVMLSYVTDLDINLALKNNGYTPLHVAASAGILSTVNYLTSSGACVEARDAEGCTPLSLAAQCGHKDVISLLCVRGATVNSSSFHAETPLHKAAEVGHLDVVDFLLSKDAKVNVKNDRGLTPLHSAQVKGHVSITEKLIDKSADVIATDNHGNTPAHTWILNTKVKGKGYGLSPSSSSLATLLKRHDDAISAQNSAGESLLHLSALTGNRSLTEFLIKQGASVNQMNSKKQSALFYAKSEEVLLLLIGSGSLVNSLDENSNSLLHVYARSDDVIPDMMRTVIGQNVNVNTQNIYGKTALHCACSVGNRAKIELLLSSGARNDMVDEAGRSILHTSLSETDETLAMWLLGRNSISLTPQDKAGNTLLHLAAGSGYTRVVECLTTKGVHVSTRNKAGVTPATMAGRGNNLDSLRTILLRGGIIDPIEGGKVLMEYIRRCDTSAVKCLLEQNCKMPFTEQGETPLHLALTTQSLEVSSLVLVHGTNTSIPDQRGRTPLHIACAHCPQLESLIPRLLSGDVCSLQDDDGKTPLHYGISTCAADTLAKFLECGHDTSLQDSAGKTVAHHVISSLSSDSPAEEDSVLRKLRMLLSARHQFVNMPDNCGQTLLHATVSVGSTRIASLLLQNGANANAHDATGSTPLHMACADSLTAMATLLVDRRGEVDVQDQMGMTCLMVGLQHARANLCTEMLLVTAPDLSIRDKHGSSLLHHAACHCPSDVLELLMDQGADARSINNHHESPLHSAAFNPDNHVIEYLLSADADVNAKTSDGNTALHLCAQLGSYAHVKCLLDHGASAEIVNQSGRTAAHLAAMTTDSDVIELLIANEADVNVVDADGNTPLALSIIHNKTENSTELVDQGADVTIQNKAGDTALHHAMRMLSLDRHLMKLLVHRGRQCLVIVNTAGQTPGGVLQRRTDIDSETVAADIGLDL